jgi:hypothetical protein
MIFLTNNLFNEKNVKILNFFSNENSTIFSLYIYHKKFIFKKKTLTTISWVCE